MCSNCCKIWRVKKYWSEAAERLDVLRQLHSVADARLFLEIFLFAVVVPALLRLKPNRLESLLKSKKTGSNPEPANIRKITSYVDSVLRVGTPLVSDGCLTRGLTLYYFLSRSGLDLAVCFGIGKVEGEFLGHCWLVKDQEPFLEIRDPRPLFKEVFRFPHPVPPLAT